MDKREALRSMLNSLINDKTEEATLDFHNYVTLKSQELTGIGGNAAANTDVNGQNGISDDHDED